MLHVSMFSMKMYSVDTINCLPVLLEETLVGYMGQKVAVSGGGYRPNSMYNNIHGWRMKG